MPAPAVPVIMQGLGYLASALRWGMVAAEITALIETVGRTISGLNENETAAFKRFVCEYAEDIEQAMDRIEVGLTKVVKEAHWLAFDPTGEVAFQKPQPKQRDIRRCSEGDSAACARVEDAKFALADYEKAVKLASERYDIDVREEVLQGLQNRGEGSVIPALAIRSIDFNWKLSGGDLTPEAYWVYDNESTKKESRDIFVTSIVGPLLAQAERDVCPDKVKLAIGIAVEMFKLEIDASARSISSDPSWLSALALTDAISGGLDPSKINQQVADAESDLRDILSSPDVESAIADQRSRERERKRSGPRFEWISNEFVSNSTSVEDIGYNSMGTGVCNLLEQYFEYNPEKLEAQGFLSSLDDIGAMTYNSFNSFLEDYIGFSFPIEEDSCGRFCGITQNPEGPADGSLAAALSCNIFFVAGCAQILVDAANSAIESGYYDQAFEWIDNGKKAQEELHDYGESIGVPRSAMSDGHYDDALNHVRRRFAPREKDDGVSLRECFIPSTKISMWDGTFKEIKDIKIGDEVLSMTKDLNPTMGIVTYVLITKIDRFIPVAKLGELTCSTTHPIFYNGEWAEIKDSTAPVEIVEEYVEEYWNLEIDAHDIQGSDHNFIADGYLMSGLGNNIALNSEYQRQPKWNDENREAFLKQRLKMGPLQSSEELIITV